MPIPFRIYRWEELPRPDRGGWLGVAFTLALLVNLTADPAGLDLWLWHSEQKDRAEEARRVHHIALYPGGISKERPCVCRLQLRAVAGPQKGFEWTEPDSNFMAACDDYYQLHFSPHEWKPLNFCHGLSNCIAAEIHSGSGVVFLAHDGEAEYRYLCSPEIPKARTLRIPE